MRVSFFFFAGGCSSCSSFAGSLAFARVLRFSSIWLSFAFSCLLLFTSLVDFPRPRPRPFPRPFPLPRPRPLPFFGSAETSDDSSPFSSTCLAALLKAFWAYTHVESNCEWFNWAESKALQAFWSSAGSTLFSLEVKRLVASTAAFGSASSWTKGLESWGSIASNYSARGTILNWKCQSLSV